MPDLWSVVFLCLANYALAGAWLAKQWKTTDQSLDFSSGAYEIAKLAIELEMDDLSNSKSWTIVKTNVLDNQGITTELKYKLKNNELRRRYTINLYNTQSRILVNGYFTGLFKQEHLKDICIVSHMNNICKVKNRASLDSMNTALKRTGHSCNRNTVPY